MNLDSMKEILAAARREEKPLALTEVFPDLLEGKRSINVKI